jgi:Fe-S cluster assembly protein SufD
MQNLEPTGFDLGRFDAAALAQLGAGEPDAARAHRAAAFDLFRALPVPAARDAEWRHSPGQLFPLADFQLAAPPRAASAPPTADWATDFDAVIEVGDETFSLWNRAASLELLPLAEAPAALPAGAPQEARKFAALGQAFWTAGFFIRARAGEPLRLLVNWRFSVSGKLHVPRLFVVVEPNAYLTLVERFQGLEKETTSFSKDWKSSPENGHDGAWPSNISAAGGTRSVASVPALAVIGAHEFHVGADATLERVALHEWSGATVCIAEDAVVVAARGRADWVTAVLGGRAVKLTAGCDVAGAGAVANLSGLYFADGAQHVDQRTVQRHSSPDTASHLLYKGAVRDQSHTIYQGLIQARRGAVRVDAYQMNRNLVLNEGARADSLPALEIDADDLKCSHGSAIGSLDPEQIFYLRARGLAEVEARRLLIAAYFEEVIGRIGHAGVQEHLRAAVAHKTEVQP